MSYYAGFDFDNLAALPGVTYSMPPSPGGTVTGTVKLTANSQSLAVRDSTFNANGAITVRERLYGPNGVTVIRDTTNNWAFGGDGSITGAITGAIS
jgi:hypothetical protein